MGFFFVENWKNIFKIFLFHYYLCFKVIFLQIFSLSRIFTNFGNLFMFLQNSCLHNFFRRSDLISANFKIWCALEKRLCDNKGNILFFFLIFEFTYFPPPSRNSHRVYFFPRPLLPSPSFSLSSFLRETCSSTYFIFQWCYWP